MKWDSIEGTKGTLTYSGGDSIATLAENNSMKLRGHTLIWHSQMPNWVNSVAKADMNATIQKHITEEATHYKGKIYAWDVVNEPFNEDGTYRTSVFYNTLGKDYIPLSLRYAHAADGNAKLYINDYNVEGKNKKSDALYELVSQLKKDNVPINGVGLQAHFIVGQIPSDLQDNMKRFSDLGLDVAITELDIRMQLPATADKLAQQAKDYASVFSTCLKVSRCVGVTVWGITDKHSWIPDVFSGYGAALLWDENYKPKEALSAVETALKA
jgi:endo-1,4-beta-xylanase